MPSNRAIPWGSPWGIMPGLCAAVAWAVPAPAQPEDHARVRLVSEHTALVPGTTATLGFAFDIDPGWHLYWNGRNDSGFAPRVELTLPEGLSAGALQWPAPKRHVLPGDILDHVYEREVTLLLPVRVAPDLRPGTRLTVKASLEWLVCEEACLPGSGGVELSLPVGAAAPLPSADARRIADARARLPRRPEDYPDRRIRLELQASGESGRFDARVDGAEWVGFYPDADCSRMPRAIGECEAKGSGLSVGLEGEDGKPVHVRGVLEARIPGEGTALYLAVRLDGPGVMEWPRPEPTQTDSSRPDGR